MRNRTTFPTDRLARGGSVVFENAVSHVFRRGRGARGEGDGARRRRLGARDPRGEAWRGPRRVVCRRRGRAGWTRASAIRPGARARGRRSLRRSRSPRRGSPSRARARRRPPPPTRPRPSLRRARTARATTTRGSRARPATRSRRWWHRERRDARRFATDPRTTFRACTRRPRRRTTRPAPPRSLARRPGRNPESRRRQRRAQCASRDTSTVRLVAPAPPRPRARAPPSAPFRARRIPRTRRGGDAAFGMTRRPTKPGAIRRSNTISRRERVPSPSPVRS